MESMTCVQFLHTFSFCCTLVNYMMQYYTANLSSPIPDISHCVHLNELQSGPHILSCSHLLLAALTTYYRFMSVQQLA